MKTEENPQRNGTGLSGGTEKLLRSYFDAFANLYGITPLCRAFRIIQKQNPELKLTEEDFLQFVDQLDQEERLYTIAGAEDIYDDVKEPTPPMKREIVAEYLYALDGFESYLELKEEQADKPYYIPEKDELLKYQDDFYSEETKEFLDLGAYLRNVLKLKRADDVLSDLQLGARCGNSEPQMIISDVERLAGRGCFHSLEQLNEFFQYYFAMYNSTLKVPAEAWQKNNRRSLRISRGLRRQMGRTQL